MVKVVFGGRWDIDISPGRACSAPEAMLKRIECLLVRHGSVESQNVKLDSLQPQLVTHWNSLIRHETEK